MHVFTNKNYVLRVIGTKYRDVKDWKYFNILVFRNKNSYNALFPESYEDLLHILGGYDKVYSFHEVESLRHGEIAYDIILEG